jgi:hypothetical protein
MLQAACPIAPAGPGHGCTGHRSHLGPLLLLLRTAGQQTPARAHGGLGLLIAVLGEATTAQPANTAGGQTLLCVCDKLLSHCKAAMQLAGTCDAHTASPCAVLCWWGCWQFCVAQGQRCMTNLELASDECA